VIGVAVTELARPRRRPYLCRTDRRAVTTHRTAGCFVQMVARMAHPLSTPQQLAGTLQPARRVARVIVVGGAGFGGAVLLGALVLWFHYGTAVFFEMMASGISACF
jgi:hypothetical protein